MTVVLITQSQWFSFTRLVRHTVNYRRGCVKYVPEVSMVCNSDARYKATEISHHMHMWFSVKSEEFVEEKQY
jgi:hypothetical protein